MKLELPKGTLTWDAKSDTQKITKKKKIEFKDILFVSNPMLMAVCFFRHTAVLYNTGPNFLTLKVTAYLKC